MGTHYIRNIKKSFEDLIVLDDVSMDFKKERVTCILGPSGCGKSTLLSIIAGMITEYEGEVVGFWEEDMSFVFQEDRLVPWLSVYENMKLILKRKYKGQELNHIITDHLSMVGIEDYASFFPEDLSGGMRQRVSIARALAYSGNLIIMDEPFKSLDRQNKIKLMRDFKIISKEAKATVIVVTHDIDEALEIGDQIYLLSDKPTRVKQSWQDLDKEGLREEILNSILKKEVD